MKVYEMISEWIVKVGVKHVFTVAAENIMPLLRSLISQGINVINAKFEPSVGFMGIVYSRLTLRPGVVLVTAGPGALGVVSPIAEAFIEGDPLVVIATVAVGGRGTQMHQLPSDYTQISVFKPITKAVFRVNEPSDVGNTLSRAFSVALSNKPGPVYVELPLNVLNGDIPVVSYPKYVIERPQVSDDTINAVMDLLADAEYPVIIVGRGVYVSGAVDLVIELAELLNAPVTTTIMAKGLVPFNHSLYAGVAAGKAGNTVAYEVIKKADVVLAIGNRFSEIGTGRYSLEIRGKLIHVNIDDYDLGRVYEPFIKVRADAKDFLMKLVSRLKGVRLRRRDYVTNELRELWAVENRELENYYNNVNGLIKPWEVIRAARDVFNRGGTIFIGDDDAHRIESFLMSIYTGEYYITSTSYVSMGLAVPGAVATSIIYPDRDVVAFVGDGGFLMTGLEVSTAVQYGAKPKIIVFNDSAYRVLGIYEKVRFGSVTEPLVRIPQVDFASLARALGGEGITITRREDLKPLLMDALNIDKAVVVDVHVDPNAVPIPYQRLYNLRSIS
ncbi:MAG: thiamine pyrophosphate-binding protein [Vulcanisaeta sp.]